MNKPKRGEFYEHFKGGTYKIVGYALDTETQIELILYKSFKDNVVWARPSGMFMETVERDGERKPRFQKIQ
jgi:hypothetical protein